MLNKNHKFIETLGSPNEDYLELYLDFIEQFSFKVKPDGVYTEIHHILPKSVFPEFKEDEDNLSILTYKDHCDAHQLLALAYPINEFVRPLNWMLDSKCKNDSNYKELLSESHKNMWKRLRNEKEFYDNFCKKRSDYMVEAMKKGHPHYEKNCDWL